MAIDRSRLLLNEIIPPGRRHVPLQKTLWDVQMMVLLGGRERTESERKELVNNASGVDEIMRLEVIQD